MLPPQILPRLALAFFPLTLAVLALVSLAQDPAAPPKLPDTQTEPGFIPIFNGVDLEGWDGTEGLWSVEDGAITGRTSDNQPIPYNKFLVWSDGELDDFELKLHYRIESGNSGIQIRSFLREGPDQEGNPLSFSVAGYQADLDAARDWAGTNYGEGYGGILAKRGEKALLKGTETPPAAPDQTQPPQPKLIREVESLGDPAALQALIKDQDWNEFHIIARGPHIQHFINGTLMAEVIDERPEARAKGILALQLHRGPAMKVQFRDIQLKRLPLSGDRKKVVFIAGPQSHALGHHEHNAGCLLLASLLDRHFGDKILTSVYRNGWPRDTTALQNADAIVMYSDGQTRHVAFWHRRQLNILKDRGVGIGAIHYATEMHPDETNQDLISWTGAAFEIHHSVNPHWDAEFTSLPPHPVSRGVRPFTLHDEWYFNLRFAPSQVTPILSAIPQDSTMSRPDGHHSGNPTVRQMVADRVPQHVFWTYDRPDGGRGFGTTGGHYHDNWRHNGFRTAVLNAIAWIAKVEVPENGVQTPTPTEEEMLANLDPNQKPAPPRDPIVNTP